MAPSKRRQYLFSLPLQSISNTHHNTTAQNVIKLIQWEVGKFYELWDNAFLTTDSNRFRSAKRKHLRFVFKRSPIQISASSYFVSCIYSAPLNLRHWHLPYITKKIWLQYSQLLNNITKWSKIHEEIKIKIFIDGKYSIQFGTLGKATGRRGSLYWIGHDKLTALENQYFFSGSIYIKQLSFKQNVVKYVAISPHGSRPPKASSNFCTCP